MIAISIYRTIHNPEEARADSDASAEIFPRLVACIMPPAALFVPCMFYPTV
jgi:hypothetical protein